MFPPADHRTAVPASFRLRDGCLLTTPRPRTARQLTVGDWLLVDDRPRQVTDLRSRIAGGRIAHFGAHAPLVLTDRDTVLVYTVVPVPPITRQPDDR